MGKEHGIAFEKIKVNLLQQKAMQARCVVSAVLVAYCNRRWIPRPPPS